MFLFTLDWWHLDWSQCPEASAFIRTSCQPRNAGNLTVVLSVPELGTGQELITNPGYPYHEIITSSPHMQETWSVFLGAESQQFRLTGVMGQAGVPPFHTHHWFTRPPALTGEPSAATQRTPQSCALAFLHPHRVKGLFLINEQVS